MKILRLLSGFAAASLLTATAFASDPAGAWNWSMNTPNGDIETTLTLVLKDGKVTGTYSNSYGETPVSTATFKDDQLTLSVDREIGGNKFVVKLQGKVDGDTIKGSIEVPSFDGGESRKIDWTAKRVVAPAPKEKPATPKA